MELFVVTEKIVDTNSSKILAESETEALKAWTNGAFSDETLHQRHTTVSVQALTGPIEISPDEDVVIVSPTTDTMQ